MSLNPRFLDMANRLKNDSLPAEKPRQSKPESKSVQSGSVKFPDLPSESFIFSYDGPHRDFAQELIAKNNEVFKGTRAEIPTGSSGEVQGHLVKRMGVITTVYNNPQLKSANLYPITPAQSEALLKSGNLTNPKSNWEDLGMVLYDRSQSGYNPKEAQAIYDSLKAYRLDLGLSGSDLENKLIIVNAGVEVDSSMPHGVKLIVLPGLTQVYQHEILEKVGENPSFDGYGLNGGLPLLNQLGSGRRTLYMPDETEDIGLRVLFRNWDLVLSAGDGDLANGGSGGRVNFAPQGRTRGSRSIK